MEGWVWCQLLYLGLSNILKSTERAGMEEALNSGGHVILAEISTTLT
jgi:hypothetical protein